MARRARGLPAATATAAWTSDFTMTGGWVGSGRSRGGRGLRRRRVGREGVGVADGVSSTAGARDDGCDDWRLHRYGRGTFHHGSGRWRRCGDRNGAGAGFGAGAGAGTGSGAGAGTGTGTGSGAGAGSRGTVGCKGSPEPSPGAGSGAVVRYWIRGRGTASAAFAAAAVPMAEAARSKAPSPVRIDFFRLHDVIDSPSPTVRD